MHRYSRFGLFTSLSAASFIIAFVQPSAARIVYTQTNVVLRNAGTIPIDLNNDGNADVTIRQSFRQQGCWTFYAGAAPATGTSIISTRSGPDGDWASDLDQGQIVGPADPFVGANAVLSDVYDGPVCPFPHSYGLWGNAGPHYLGIAFTKNGHLRYGWAELNISLTDMPPLPGITTTLMGYAYQTTAGKSIMAGQTR